MKKLDGNKDLGIKLYLTQIQFFFTNYKNINRLRLLQFFLVRVHIHSGSSAKEDVGLIEHRSRNDNFEKHLHLHRKSLVSGHYVIVISQQYHSISSIK